MGEGLERVGFLGGRDVEFAGPTVTVEPGPSGGPGKLSEALGLARDAPEEPAVELHICHPRIRTGNLGA